MTAAAPFKTCLCAVDLGSTDDAPLKHADAVCRLYGARLIAFHAMPDLARSAPLFPHLAQADNARFVAIERRVLEALQARVAAVTGRSSADVDLKLGFGSPHSAILEEAERVGADLIVIGAGRPQGLLRVILGAVAERVVRYAHCPVWIARGMGPVGRVVGATDLSDPSTPAIAQALDFARRAGVPVTVAHALALPQVLIPSAAAEIPAYPLWTAEDVDRARERARTHLAKAVGALGEATSLQVLDAAPVTGIVALADAFGAGLICIGTRGRSGLARILLGSVAEEVVRTASCSVLVVRLTATHA